MITKINNTKELYRAQFEAINNAFQEADQSIRINSLEDYFSNIRQIAQLTKKGSDIKGKFLIMPLDEPFFEIDANARVINIPANFKKNGVGVQNDHWAEILYFKVDRYYDYQDLAALNIFINWQFIPSGNKSAEPEIIESKAFAPDPDFDPNHLVFGWVVDRHMTPSKGTLKFSVTFTDSVHPGVAQGYQLSTLVASVNVNEGLIPQPNAQIITTNDNDFFSRITNSAIHSDGIDGVLGAVSWKRLPLDANQNLILNDGSELAVYSVGEDSNAPIIEKRYFPVIVRENDIYAEQDILHLAAEGVTSDIVDDVVYIWATSYLTTDDVENTNFETIQSDEDNDKVYLAYVKSNDTVARADTVYYAKQADNTFKALQLQEAVIHMEESPEVPLYELVCIHDIDRGGYYTVRAQSKAIKETHTLTEDETVITGKIYQKQEDGIFVNVENPSGNPKEEGWYEPGTKTCNSQIKYSNKFIYVPNAEQPEVIITTINRYLPEEKDYVITDPETEYSYIGLDRNQQELPIIHVELNMDQMDGIGGTNYKIGSDITVDQITPDLTVEDILAASRDGDHSNSEFSRVGDYKHITIWDAEYSDLGANTPEYYIRVFNQKNHTFSVTDKILAMKLSYVAPAIKDFDVYIGDSDVKLLESGETPREDGRFVEFGLTEETRPSIRLVKNLTEDTSSMLGQNYDESEISYRYYLQEVDYDDNIDVDGSIRANRSALQESTDTKGSNLIEIKDLDALFDIPDKDTGFYRIKVVTSYHNTEKVAYTDLFRVVIS